MEWEQKLQALQALAEYPEHAQVIMREPGNWYCSVKGIEVKDAHTLTGEYGNGKTPQEAVEACFAKLSCVPSDKVIVRNAMTEKRKHFRWNGFMWREEAVDATS